MKQAIECTAADWCWMTPESVARMRAAHYTRANALVVVPDCRSIPSYSNVVVVVGIVVVIGLSSYFFHIVCYFYVRWTSKETGKSYVESIKTFRCWCLHVTLYLIM